MIYLLISLGTFLEYFTILYNNPANKAYEFLGEKDHILHVTAIEDIGKFIAAAVHDPSRWELCPKKFCIVSDVDLSFSKFEKNLRELGDQTPVYLCNKLKNKK